MINLLESSNYIPLIDADEVEVTFKFALHLDRNRVELRAAATVDRAFTFGTWRPEIVGYRLILPGSLLFTASTLFLAGFLLFPASMVKNHTQ